MSRCPGWPGTLWLTDEERVDRDSAVFGEFTYDYHQLLQASAGIRHYTFDNTLYGFYGFNSNFSGSAKVLPPASRLPCRSTARLCRISIGELRLRQFAEAESHLQDSIHDHWSTPPVRRASGPAA